jgi:hypothetical protein
VFTPEPAPGPTKPLQRYGKGAARCFDERAASSCPARWHPSKACARSRLGELVLLPDGRVTVCCADLNARGSSSGIRRERSLREIFNSEGRASMIDAFRQENTASIPLREDCAWHYDCTRGLR